MGRKLIEVEADVGFEVWADTIEGLFVEAARALYDIMVDVNKVDPKEKREVNLNAPNLEMLMHFWLSELLFITDVEGLVFSKFDVKIEGNELEAICYGEPIDVEKHNPKTEVKAITYHRFSVTREDGFWKATVIVDL